MYLCYPIGERVVSMNQTNDEEIIANSIIALNSISWKIRVQAAEDLISFGTSAIMPLMLKVKQGFFNVAALPEAVRVLGTIGDVQIVDLLIEMLSSNQVHAAQEAAKGLGRVGDPRAIPALIDVFRRDWNDEETVAMWQEASRALARIGDTALFPLITALQDQNSAVRSGVIDALSQLKDPRTVDPLLGMLQDPDSQVRADAISALAQIGDEKEAEPLTTMLKDENWYIRCRVLYALGDLRVSSTIDTIALTLHDPEPRVRSAAAIALGKFNNAQPFLIELLKDSASEVRGAAALALGQIGDEKAIPALQQMQQHDTGHWGKNSVRDHAAYAIKSIQEKRAEH